MKLVRKLIRYATVSVVATAISQIVLATLVATRSTGAVTANVIATLCGVVPSFELNRRWVWGKTGRRSITGEVVPFVMISACGLALSSFAVAIASDATSGAGTTTRTLVIQAANLTAFGLVWLAQFALLELVLFRSRPTGRAITAFPAPWTSPVMASTSGAPVAAVPGGTDPVPPHR